MEHVRSSETHESPVHPGRPHPGRPQPKLPPLHPARPQTVLPHPCHSPQRAGRPCRSERARYRLRPPLQRPHFPAPGAHPTVAYAHSVLATTLEKACSDGLRVLGPLTNVSSHFPQQLQSARVLQSSRNLSPELVPRRSRCWSGGMPSVSRILLFNMSMVSLDSTSTG